MYSNRSPPTVPAGIEFPNISMPGMCGMAPSTGINRSRRYSSILGIVLIFVIPGLLRPKTLRRFGDFLEESLLGRGLPQCGVAIHVRRQPTLQSFGLEYRAMNRVVVAHGRECVDETALALGVEIGPCREHAMVVGRRGPYVT